MPTNCLEIIYEFYIFKFVVWDNMQLPILKVVASLQDEGCETPAQGEDEIHYATRNDHWLRGLLDVTLGLVSIGGDTLQAFWDGPGLGFKLLNI